MTSYDAIEVAASCKGSFPLMTKEQVDDVRREMHGYSVDAATKALQEMVNHVESWNTHRFLAIVRRHQLQLNDSSHRVTSEARRADDSKLKGEYELAIAAAAETSDDELQRMRDTLFESRPDLRDAYGAGIDPRKRQSLLLVMFRPNSFAARF